MEFIMSSLSVFDLLAMHDTVSDLPANWLQRLAGTARPVFLGLGHRLCREDAHADHFWLINSGTVAIDFYVPGRGDIVVERVGAGAPVGWSWMRPPFRWRFGAVVADNVHAIEFDAARVRTLIKEDPDLGRELTGRILDVVSGRLQSARHRLIELYAYPKEAGC
jgi:CRP/FNR family cyclic AMP-dependent transcriptional regulator